jgi:hypothetical protein
MVHCGITAVCLRIIQHIWLKLCVLPLHRVQAAHGAQTGYASFGGSALIAAAAAAPQNTLRWVGRLPGDLMSSIPGDFEAWWLGPGLAFNSHPLR